MSAADPSRRLCRLPSVDQVLRSDGPRALLDRSRRSAGTHAVEAIGRAWVLGRDHRRQMSPRDAQDAGAANGAELAGVGGCRQISVMVDRGPIALADLGPSA